MLARTARITARVAARRQAKSTAAAATHSSHAAAAASPAAAAAAETVRAVSRTPPAETKAEPEPKAAAAPAPFADKSDAEVAAAVADGRVRFFDIERMVGDHARAVAIRRQVVVERTGADLDALPHSGYDYARIHGLSCENVVGYMPVPVGVIGPLLVNGKEFHVPMATTEGALIASAQRGARALSASGGVSSFVMADGITRAPVLRAPNTAVAVKIAEYVEANFDELAAAFATTTRFGKLTSVTSYVAGRRIYLRCVVQSGDAMGMNMAGKGSEQVVNLLTSKFPCELESLSGNLCTDKKPSAINWTNGRGKTVVADATIQRDVVEKVLKSTVKEIVSASIYKNLVGSALAGSIGGQNCHAANIVAAVFLATGQDIAQLESANCLTLYEETEDGDLYMSIRMPSLEVGTVGGGTGLPAQSAALGMIGVSGSGVVAGDNAKQLARVMAGAVMSGELSLMAALSANHLIKSHMALNRK